VQNAGIPAKSAETAEGYKTHMGLRRGQHRGAARPRRSGWRVTGRGQKPVAAPEVRQPQRVTRFTAKRYRRASRVAPVQLRRGPRVSRVVRAP